MSLNGIGKRLRTRLDIGIDIQSCLDDMDMTHARFAEILALSEKTVDRMIAGKGPTTKYASRLSKATGKPESWFKENIAWDECGKEEVISAHFEAKNIPDKDKEFASRMILFMEKMYSIQDDNIRNMMMKNIEKSFEGNLELMEMIIGKTG